MTLASADDYFDVAFSRSGDIIAAWTQSESGQRVLYLRRFTSAGGWEIAQPYTTTANSVLDWPAVAINDSGDAIVAWRYDSGSPNLWTVTPLKAIRYTAGSGWGSVVAVDDSTTLRYDNIDSLFITSSGDGLIVRDDDYFKGLVTYGYRDGLGWGSRQTLTSTLGMISSWGGSMNPAGAGVQVWRERIDPNYFIRAQVY